MDTVPGYVAHRIFGKGGALIAGIDRFAKTHDHDCVSFYFQDYIAPAIIRDDAVNSTYYISFTRLF